jgi:hypothetical protein
MIKKLSIEEFRALKPKSKVQYFDCIMHSANDMYAEQYAIRNEQTQGSAFLWVSLYGKGSINTAFRAYIKKYHARKIMTNYRGSPHAWYFGSQTSVGIWDGLRGMCKVLNTYDIECYVEDEWD